MTRNETFFKILFAISLALLPMTIFSYLFLPQWSVGLFVAGILLAKIWIELFRDKFSFAHTIINAINSVAVFTTLLILFAVADVISLALAICTIVAVVLMNVLRVVLFKHSMPEYIDAVDYCHMLFECLTLLAFTFVLFYDLIANIGIFALLITAIVSVIYKIYFIIKHTDFKNIFKRKK